MGRDATKATGNPWYEARKAAAKYDERLYSREGAAEMLGMSVSAVADAELGTAKVMPVDKAVLMADLYFMRNGKERTCYKEVSFAEYNKGQANWKSKPATMINKVAISQCVRDAFPKDYEGLYTIEEMQASGAIPAEYRVIEDTGEVIEEKHHTRRNRKKQTNNITEKQSPAQSKYEHVRGH